MEKSKDFLQLLSKNISERIKDDHPIPPEEVYRLMEDTLSSLTDIKMFEIPVFVDTIVKKEDDFYTAKCPAFHQCRGLGNTEKEAVENLKKEIKTWNDACVNTEKRMNLEKMFESIFIKDN